MGYDTFTRDAFVRAREEHVPRGSRSTTERAEQKARETGKLDPLVDPAGFNVIRRSLLRFEQCDNKLWQLTVGTSVPIETRLDTTGSMGGNVDIAMRVLPDAFELFAKVLPGCDIHVATGIFGDVSDNFVLCRPQFEMLAEKVVKQLTLMVPERDGGDEDEDPHYGLFGAAYLVDAYINRIGLKGYDFTISDASAHDYYSAVQLVRVFGEEVFDKVAANGHEIKRSNLPSIKEVVEHLLKRAHAFFLQVGENPHTKQFWSEIFGANRVVVLPRTEVAPHVQAAIIGLTEGTLSLRDVEKFLTGAGLSSTDAEKVVRSVVNIPIGAQAALPNYNKRPKKGDLFKEKTDLWPISADEAKKVSTTKGKKSEGGPGWLN